MRALRAAGVALGVLSVAAVAAVGATPQAATKPGQTVEKPGQTVEKQVIIEQRPGEPVVVIERQGDGRPYIVMPQGQGWGGGSYRPAVAGGGPRLGVEIRDVSKEDVATLKLSSQQGVVVAEVTTGSAAEKAGLKTNDVVVAYDGETVRSAQQLARLIRETAPGRTVKIAMMRDGKRMDLEATPDASVDERVSVYVNPDQIRGDVARQLQGLDERTSRQLRELREQLNQYRFERRAPAPNEEGPRFRMEGPPASGNFQWFGREGGPLEMLLEPGRGRLGVTVQELTPELATYFGVKAGVLVARVAADSPAAKAGIKAGDVITTVDDKPVTTASEITVLLAVKTGEVPIGLTRERKSLTLKATIAAPAAPGRRVVLRGAPV